MRKIIIMGTRKSKLSPKASLPFKTANKLKRQDLHVKQKKARENLKRDERMRLRREEDKNPGLREERVRKNIPLTLDRKRVWDQIDNDTGDGLGVSVDIGRLKKQKLEEEAASNAADNEAEDGTEDDSEDQEHDRDSMIDFGSDPEEDSEPPKLSKQLKKDPKQARKATERATSPTPQSTTSTNLDLTPEALAARFPTLFLTTTPPTLPKNTNHPLQKLHPP